MAALNRPIFNPTRRCEAARQACLLGTVNPGSNYTGAVGTPLLREPHPTDQYVGPAIRRPSGVDDPPSAKSCMRGSRSVSWNIYIFFTEYGCNLGWVYTGTI
ncbi:hypothetical protein X797_008970 [Metarhizium robertsii]|uniref:Uncharacterized protein n=1 Tax=Metarhizium robertsii TaxID=568076 RepID=A0A014NAQ9_9HYPO|nr:hypothetical protein X797_008970 [Metarhizium robertsii]